jgi:hypothetical protein
MSKGEKSPTFQKLAEMVGKVKKGLKNNQEFEKLDRHILLEEFSKTGDFKLPESLEKLFSTNSQEILKKIEK